MELKDACKKVREVLGISQKQMAEMIGSTQTEVSFIERGFQPVNTNKAAEIFRKERLTKMFNGLVIMLIVTMIFLAMVIAYGVFEVIEEKVVNHSKESIIEIIKRI